MSEATSGALCAKRGALWAYHTPKQFRLTSPVEKVATYQWGSRAVKHHFCASCGCVAGLVDGQA